MLGLIDLAAVALACATIIVVCMLRGSYRQELDEIEDELQTKDDELASARGELAVLTQKVADHTAVLVNVQDNVGRLIKKMTGETLATLGRHGGK